ncbi:MAG: OmpA family protein [Nitrospirae bacterium]|nr:OmpA family protein [Nitrospirota bacterium]
MSTNEKISDSNRLVIDLEDIFFDFDKDIIKPDSYSMLDRNIQLLKANPSIQIIIEGHTDERGTNEYNLTLSDRRSRSTKRYLVAGGIAPDRIRTIAYGEERPFCYEQTEDCYQLNRRAHFSPSD